MDRAEIRRLELRQGMARCSRCGRTRTEAPGEWNVAFVDGVISGYVCPDDQTAEENAEAVINEATGARLPRTSGRAGDPTGMTQHASLVTEGVWQEWLEMVLSLPEGETASFDATGLADETLGRLSGTIGEPRGSAEANREGLAMVFQGFAEESLG